MLPEPLTATTRILDAHNLIAQVHAADGSLAADAPYVVNIVAKCGSFGEMNIRDQRAAPRQRARCLVLLVREALQTANMLGVVYVETRAPDRLTAFAARLTGIAAPDRLDAAHVHFRGSLAEIRTRTLDETDETGDYRPTPHSTLHTPDAN